MRLATIDRTDAPSAAKPIRRDPVGCLLGLLLAWLLPMQGLSISEARAGTTPGAIIAWGDDGLGQCDVPASVGPVTQVAGGYLHTVALRGDGAAAAWGLDTSGQCKVPAGAASGVIQVGAGLYHSLAVKVGGSVLAWGYNGSGQCTVPVAAQAGVAQVAGGYAHSLAVKSDGTLLAWGSASNGQTTIPIAARSGVSQVAAGVLHSLALKSGGVVAWGDNARGQCAVPALAQSGVVQVASGYYHALALRSNGAVVAWGANASGQSTVPAAASTGVARVAAGYLHSVALKADGAAVAWGDRNERQTRPPSSASRSVVDVGAGGFHSLAVVAVPTLTGVTPSSGPLSGGTSIVIAGANLAGATVSIDGKAATSVVSTASSITAKTPAGTVGAKNVVVSTVGGSATRAGGFTYVSSLLGGMPTTAGGSGPDFGTTRSVHEYAILSGRPSGAERVGSDVQDAIETEVLDGVPAAVKEHIWTVWSGAEPDVDCISVGLKDAEAAGDSETLAGAVAMDMDGNGVPDLCQLRHGDLDLSGHVDGFDVTALLQWIGQSPLLGIGDLDGDGAISASDAALMMLRFD